MSKIDNYRRNNGQLPSFTLLGGYPLLYLDAQNNVLCPDCANDADCDPPASDYGINWEDPFLTCDQCSQRIESAYAEAEAKEFSKTDTSR